MSEVISIFYSEDLIIIILVYWVNPFDVFFLSCIKAIW